MSAGAGSRDWDAATYHRVSDIQFTWALEQLERLTLRGDEVVLDAGCGSGRVTALLADRVPDGRVYGVDVAPSMAEHAQEALGDRATVFCQDLVELSLPEPVDVIFSNATFHWIKDHDALFAALHRTLAPGGRLVAQCGGLGNIDAFRRLADDGRGARAVRAVLPDWHGPWNYADAESRRRLVCERAGFADVETWLEPKSVTPEDPRAFIQTVCVVRHLDLLPDELKEPFVDRVLAESGEPFVLDYVRLNMTGRRA